MKDALDPVEEGLSTEVVEHAERAAVVVAARGELDSGKKIRIASQKC